MIPPWIGCSIWKFWVISVLVSLVFHVFSTTELILHCKNSEFCRLRFSIIFLHDFTLFGIDMHQNRSISLFKTLFDHFHFYPLVALKCYPHLIMCHNKQYCHVVQNCSKWFFCSTDNVFRKYDKYRPKYDSFTDQPFKWVAKMGKI